MASEPSIQSSIIDYINSLIYGRAENVSGNAQQSGRADINACIYGWLLKIEVKTEDTEYGRKGMTTKQRLYLEKWARAGAMSCVAYNLDDAKFVIDKLLKSHSLFSVSEHLELSGRGKWYDVQNKRWVDISY